MTRANRVVVLAVSALAVLGACRRKPEAAPAPAPAPAPRETCDQRCRDSIAAVEAARRAAEEEARRRAEEEARRRAVEAALATLAAKVYFDFDRSDLRPDARSVLDAKLPILRANPGLRLRISGHADERGSDEYNLALGQARAAAVRRYLMDNGIDGGRLEIVSFGEARPAVDGHDESAWSQNRRCEFEIVAGRENIVVPSAGGS